MPDYYNENDRPNWPSWNENDGRVKMAGSCFCKNDSQYLEKNNFMCICEYLQVIF